MTQDELTDDEIRTLVAALETVRWSEEEVAWQKLKGLGARVVPFLAEAYPKMKKWQGRVSVVFHSMRYVRDHEAAIQLGLAALDDRATLVRYRACMMLAFALDKRAVESLKALLKHEDQRTAEDAAAALDAIKHQNHHYFIDRRHTGKMKLNIG